MSIRTKILIGFLTVSLMGVALGVTGLVASYLFTTKTTDLKTLTKQADDFDSILSAHYVWRNGLYEAVMTGTEFTGSLDPTTCAFGKWYQSEAVKGVTDPQILEMLSQVVEPHGFFHREAKGVVQLIAEDNQQEAIDDIINVLMPKFQEVITLLQRITERYTLMIEEKESEAVESASKTMVVIVIIIVIVLILSIILALVISRKISEPISVISAFFKKAGATGDIALSEKEVALLEVLSRQTDEIGELSSGATSFLGHVTHGAKALESIAEGDLDLKINQLSAKDTMGLSLHRMVENLNSMFGEINGTAVQVSTGAKQVADGSQTLAQGATEQAASIEELSTSIGEVTNMAKENTQAATTAMDEVEKASELMGVCLDQMGQMLVAMQAIDEKSNNISKTTKLIDEIAFQTNILALNAAVEAARAGQHGKGFAVVAEEVRNLAAKSAEAAKETGDLIESSTASVAEGSRIVEKVSGSLQMVSDISTNQATLISNIQTYSLQQSDAMEQISIGIDQVAQVVQQNSAAAEESAAAAEEMSSQSTMLQELTSQFRLRGE